MGLFMVLLTLAGGISLSAQSSINGTFARKAGTFETSLLTFFTGALFMTVVVLFFGQGNIVRVFEVPKWQLFCAVLGVSFMFLTVFTVPKIGVAGANITAVTGQLLGSMIIDQYGLFGGKQVPVDTGRALGLLFMLFALYFIFRSQRRSIK
ncbi:DMT family transporter [Fictibacillus fluitans]|uniref:DMT family transporter n=1 Tax=Fictibacillus fluitans TaxID=3058422 RepID=A0ABT8HYL0_9BACL|nr:DMT family transporter [Fictibacillus sp. NE201]MDN4525869.1 DMT family transporter [Fictibacillus sp. NE201]